MASVGTEIRPSFGLPARRFSYPSHKTFLSQAALLEEAGPPQVSAQASLLGMAFVFISGIASIMIDIDVMSSSRGRIISAEPNQILQSFEGGLVGQLHVEEGQIVDAGETLLTLYDPEAEATLDRLRARKISLEAQVAKLRTLAGLPTAPATNEAAELRNLWNEQMAIVPLSKAAIAAERTLVRAEISHRLEALASLHDLLERASLTSGLAMRQLATQRHLHAKGLVTESLLLDAERDAADARFELTSLEGKIKEAETSLLESKKRLDDVVAERGSKLGDQLSTILMDQGEVDKQIVALQDRLERGVVRAPIDSIVHELLLTHSGQSVAPGEKLVELVPADADLVVEAQLPTTEISYIRIGLPVRIAIDGIEPHRHGFLHGEVTKLSPSTFIDENGLPYYRAIVALKEAELADISLIPGMTVQAQIKTDQRTILEYMLKPVYRAWETAFRER